MPERYRKRPVEIEAMQVEQDMRPVVWWIVGNGGSVGAPTNEPCLYIWTPEGAMRAEIGDYVIRGVEGEFYPCKPSVFEATYEPVESDGPIAVYW